MALLHPPHYFASTETVPADSLTWSTVGLAKFVTLSSLAGVKRLQTTLNATLLGVYRNDTFIDSTDHLCFTKPKHRRLAWTPTH